MISDNYVTGDNIYLRELQNFFFEVLGMMSVTHYGAIGDGRTDCYGALQVAIDDAKRRKLSYIYVPMGRYIYTGELINMDGITFIGNPHAKIVNIRTCEEIPIKQFGADTIDCYTKIEADGRFVKIPGDTMTGSLAIGSTSTASGDLSFAQGESNTASGKYSHAQGWNNTASGMYSFAGGTLATASGFDSLAFGNYIVEPNEYIGNTRGNQATGNTSIALGTNTIASGKTATSTGLQTTASGECSFTQGYKTTASGTNSHAEGEETVASGKDSHAEGKSSTASNNNSHAEGNSTTASGFASHAEGQLAEATAHVAHAEGYNTTASARESHAEGGTTVASAESSHAEGKHTKATGYAAHAEGYGTIARGKGQHAEGNCNIEDTTATENSDEWGTYLHIVGNGTGVYNRSNAHTIDRYGEAWFAGDVYVGSTSGTNKDAGSKKLATEEYVDTHGGGSKSIITAELSEDYEATALSPSEYDVPMTVVESSGSGFSIQNNKIVVGSGITKVKISALANVWSDAAGNMSMYLIRHSFKDVSVTKAIEAGKRDTLSIPTILLSVSPGDTLNLSIKIATGDTIFGNSGGKVQTWLTVEEV